MAESEEVAERLDACASDLLPVVELAACAACSVEEGGALSLLAAGAVVVSELIPVEALCWLVLVSVLAATSAFPLSEAADSAVFDSPPC